MDILLEWIILILPIIISIVSLIMSIKYKKKLRHIILGCSNFALAIYIPMCNFSYFSHSYFIGRRNESDINYLIKDLANTSRDGWNLLILNLIVITISVVNCIYIFKKNKQSSNE